MQNKFLKVVVFCFFVCTFLTPALVSADPPTVNADKRLWGPEGSSDVDKAKTKKALGLKAEKDPRILIAQVIQVILGFLGIIAVVLILYAGFKWMMSKGNAEDIKSAKDIMINAAIGLAIILSAYSIAELVIREFVKAGK